MSEHYTELMLRRKDGVVVEFPADSKLLARTCWSGTHLRATPNRLNANCYHEVKPIPLEDIVNTNSFIPPWSWYMHIQNRFRANGR